MDFQFKNKYIGYICFAAVILLLGNSVFQTFRPLDEEFEAKMSYYEKVSADANAACDEAEAFRKEADSVFESIDEEFEMIAYVADQYYDLSQKEEFTAEDLAMLKFYYDYLVSHGINLK